MLKAVSRAENGKSGCVRYNCTCECGQEKTVQAKHLKSGAIDNCGCLKAGRCIETRKAHGNVHGGNGTRLYNIWCGMKSRCYNQNRDRYHDYGGRGITVCDEWLHDFAAFRDWSMANGYTDTLTIDRIDNDKGYSPDNCCWKTLEQQNQNRRPRRSGGKTQ